jgi:hypothetical protein
MCSFFTTAYHGNSLRTDGDFCHRGRHTEIAKIFTLVETYRHDHSLGSSRGALSDGTIGSSIPPDSGEKMHFLNSSQKTSVLKELRELTLVGIF